MLQDRRTGGGETGGDFKQRVDIAADLAGEHKGQRPHQAEQNPGKGDDNIAVLLIERHVLRFFGEQLADRHAADEQREINRGDGPFAVDGRGDKRQGKEQPLHPKHGAEHVANHRKIHGGLLIQQNVGDVPEAGIGGDHHGGIPGHQGVFAAGNHEMIAADDARDQGVRLDAQFAEGDVGQAAARFDGEFHGFGPAVGQFVKPLHVAAHRIGHGPHVAQDGFGGDALGIDDGIQRKARDHLVKIQMADLGDHLLFDLVHRVKGEDDVLFVDAGAGNQRVHIGKMFFPKDVFVAAVGVDNRGGRQFFAQLFAAGAVLLDDFDADARFDEHLRQIIGRFAAADDHRVFDGVGFKADPVEKVRGAVRRQHYREHIAGLDAGAAVGNGHLTVPFEAAHEHILAQQRHILDRTADEGPRRRRFEAVHLDAPLGEAADIDGGGKSQQPGDFPGSGVFGVDRHRQAQRLLDIGTVFQVNRIAHPGDGFALGKPAGQHAAQQVDLVAVGHGDEDIGPPDIGPLEHLVARAVARNAHDVVNVGRLADPLRVGVDDGDVVVFL